MGFEPATASSRAWRAAYSGPEPILAPPRMSFGTRRDVSVVRARACPSRGIPRAVIGSFMGMSRRVRGRRIEPPTWSSGTGTNGVRTGASRGAPSSSRSKSPTGSASRPRAITWPWPHTTSAGASSSPYSRVSSEHPGGSPRGPSRDEKHVTADAEADDRFVVAASTRSGRRRKGARRPTRSRGLGATRTLE